jgi:hypothetical protein
MLRGGRWGKPLGAIGVLMDLSFAGELSGPFAAAGGDGSTHDVRRLVGCNKHDGLGDLFGSPRIQIHNTTRCAELQKHFGDMLAAVLATYAAQNSRR